MPDPRIEAAAAQGWAEFWNASDDAQDGHYVYSATPTTEVSRLPGLHCTHVPARVFGDQDEAEQEQWRSIARTMLAALGAADAVREAERCQGDAFCVLPAGHAGQHSEYRPTPPSDLERYVYGGEMMLPHPEGPWARWLRR